MLLHAKKTNDASIDKTISAVFRVGIVLDRFFSRFFKNGLALCPVWKLVNHVDPPRKNYFKNIPALEPWSWIKIIKTQSLPEEPKIKLWKWRTYA